MTEDVVDFLTSGTLYLDVPPGVTYDSDSGVFSAPEPGAPALAAAALAAVAARCRRQRCCIFTRSRAASLPPAAIHAWITSAAFFGL